MSILRLFPWPFCYYLTRFPAFSFCLFVIRTSRAICNMFRQFCDVILSLVFFLWLVLGRLVWPYVEIWAGVYEFFRIIFRRPGPHDDIIYYADYKPPSETIPILAQDFICLSSIQINRYWCFYFNIISFLVLYSYFFRKYHWFFYILVGIPYDHFKKRLKKPPDIVIRFTDFVLTVASFLIVTVLCLQRLHTLRGLSQQEKCFFNAQVYTNAKKHPSVVTFTDDNITVFVDNCSNIHVCNDRSLFSSLTLRTEIEGADTIHGTGAAAGVGTVTWTWYDDDGQLYSWDFTDVQYFPDSPVNVMSVQKLSAAIEAKGLCDSRGARIDSGSGSSTLTWENGKYTRTIIHPKHDLPEMLVNPGQKTSKGQKILAVCNLIYCLFGPTSGKSVNSIGDPKIKFRCGDFVKFSEPQQHGYSIGKVIDIDEDRQWLHIFLPNHKIVDFPADAQRLLVLHDPSKLPSPEQQVSNAARQLTRAEILSQFNYEPLTNLQIELLSWHNRLKHVSFSTLKRLASIGAIPSYLADVKPPLCAACLFGDIHRRAWRNGEIPSTIRKDQDNKPGDMVSCDQLISAQPGLVPQVTGKLSSNRIWGATVFIDHATSFSHVHLMDQMTTANTIAAKHSFESKLFEYGADVTHYRADNGRFNDIAFNEDLKLKNQRCTYCGVGAHHQNGVVERHIGLLTSNARTILLHAKRIWPEMIHEMLWPYALQAASHRHNLLQLNKVGFSPLQCISKSSSVPLLKYQHTWGCPVFVLDASLQSGLGAVPKWEPRCRIGVYLGHSPSHAGSVALVLNPRTGHVSPQYHVVFDDDFTTLPYIRQGLEPPNWEHLVARSRELYATRDLEMDINWATQTGTSISEGDITPHTNEATSPSNESAETDASDLSQVNDMVATSSTSQVSEPLLSEPRSAPSTTILVSEGDEDSSDLIFGKPDTDIPTEALKLPKMKNLETIGLRRSKRKTKLIDRLNLFVCLGTLATNAILPLQHRYQDCLTLATRKFQQFEQYNTILDNQLNDVHPMSFLLKLTDNEVYHFHDAMKQPDAKEFIQAMQKEVDDHENRGHWEYVKKSDMKEGAEVINAVWSFKRKRFPDGKINKHKARLCAHGGMQTWGKSYWETYAPVVDWISIRIILVVALMYDMPMKSMDFVLAFPQAELDSSTPIYVKPPLGMDLHPDYIIKLRKSLYGLKNAGFNWYEHLKKGLIDRGFKPSLVDPCVYYKDSCIILVYVDDCVVTGKSEEDIQRFLKSLSEGDENYDFTVEEDFKNYLGVEVTKNNDGTIELSQRHLINRIISAIGYVKETNFKDTPTSKPLLNKDLNGIQRKYDWHYRSLIGMLTYLQKTSRPDLAMATHQCARFTIDPKLSHEKAVGRIVRYLIGTKDRGLIFKPDKSRGLECYADADFAGMWTPDNADDPSGLLSRTGYVMYYCGCPIFWQSKLQTEIALSTTEAEYIALSTALRQLIPTMNLLKEINQHLGIEFHKPKMGSKMLSKEFPNMDAIVHEDNKSCIAVAKSFKLTPRTKHIGLKYHHFRGYIERKVIGIEYVETKYQVADIFTKPLASIDFIRLRKMLCGW